MSVIRKTVAERDGMDFVLSDETIDRYGDVVKAEGWVLSNFRKNPIALFGHSSSFPIGTWSNVRVEGGKLVGRLVLAARGTSARIDELLSLVQQGILRAVSVGFRPMESEPIDPKVPWDGTRYLKQELLECSLVSVPANPAALQLARSLNISDETLSLAFGEHAETRRRDATAIGEHAGTKTAAGIKPAGAPSRLKVKNMNLSQRIMDAKTKLTAKEQERITLTAADQLDHDAIEAVNDEIETLERDVAVLERSEAQIGKRAALEAPAIARRPLGFPQRDVGGFDLLVRAVVARGVSHFSGKAIEKVLDERYPGHEATAYIAKADQTIGTTTGSHWADDLVQTVNQGFLDALTGFSVYPALRSRGIGLNFDGVGTVKIPRRTAGTAGGGFVAEGSPIRVGKLTTAAAELSPRKMGVIVAFSRELAKRATPQIEGLVRRAILEDTGAILDAALLDATAGSTTRPAGLLNGVSAVATGYGGGDHLAVKADFQALLAPFISANAAGGITVIMNPAQALAISLMDGPDNNSGWFSAIRERVNIVESTYATANRLIAIRNPDFVTAIGDAPEFDVSEQATIHMEDTTPLEIVSASPTTADPVRSLWQTGSTGIRMMMDVGWTMARTGMVQWIDTTSY